MTTWPDKLFNGSERLLNFDFLHHRWERIQEMGLAGYLDNEMMQPDQQFIFGLALPPFQRPKSWSPEQERRFIESSVLGLHLGTWVLNISRDVPMVDVPGYGKRFPRVDHWIIDGQQRLRAIENFFSDKFSVFGLKWSQVDPIRQKRYLHHAQFHAYETNLSDVDMLRELYDRLNFGGTPHRPEDRATRDDEAIIETAMRGGP